MQLQIPTLILPFLLMLLQILPFLLMLLPILPFLLMLLPILPFLLMLLPILPFLLMLILLLLIRRHHHLEHVTMVKTIMLLARLTAVSLTYPVLHRSLIPVALA